MIWKWLIRTLTVICAGVLAFSLYQLWSIQHEYQKGTQTYDEAVEQFVAEEVPPMAPAEQIELEYAPVRVDFDALKAVNPDVTGWIYCPDTKINYPVLHGSDNDQYLHTTYEGVSCRSGSIFVEADNARDFADYNTIIYGHHMRDGSMFCGLQYWEEQSYYDEHPVMWLLTPEQDYKVLLFSGYGTRATSAAYTIFPGPGPALAGYVKAAKDQSEFKSNVELDENAKYITLSTCAYWYEDARYVMHGMLVPVEHAKDGESLNK